VLHAVCSFTLMTCSLTCCFICTVQFAYKDCYDYANTHVKEQCCSVPACAHNCCCYYSPNPKSSMDAPQENSACRERAGGTGLQCSTFKADASIVEYRYEWLLQPPGLVSNGDSSGQPSTFEAVLRRSEASAAQEVCPEA